MAKLPSVDQQALEFNHSNMTAMTTSLQRENWVAISNVQAINFPSESNMTLEEEVTRCFQILTSRLINFIYDFKTIVFLEHLTEYGLDLSSCVNINLFIRSMDFFGRVNAIYSEFFGSSPPARACVGVDLPDNIRVRLDCVATKEKFSSDRQSLHVQGLSYWAPANIGPYSQAITVRKSLTVQFCILCSNAISG